MRPLEPIQVVEAVLDSVRPAATSKEVELQPALEHWAGLIHGDPDRLQQVVWNLLSNAIKFTPRGGRVQVSLRRVDTAVELQVSDTGQGIPEGFLPYVFERFRQADSGSTRAHGGLGLGLSIVRHLVELHGGTICASSEGEGRGAAFTVRIPLSAQRATEPAVRRPSPEQPPTAPPLSSPLLEGLRVLVVEDEPDTRELVAMLLEESKAAVLTASTTAEALTAFERHPPDVLLSDIGLPGEDGYSLIRRVRALPVARGGRTPAVALTASTRAEDRARAILASFNLHLGKPVEPAELLAVVASLGGRTSHPPGQAPRGLASSGPGGRGT